MMRFYRALLHLYPADFRAEYGDELCRAFAENTRGRSAPAVVAAAIGDVVPNAIATRWAMLRHGASGGMALPTPGSDIRFAMRQIAHAPLFSGVVIAVIALGIGINTGLLQTLNTYAWRPAPGIERSAQLARLTPAVNSRVNNVYVSYSDILDLRERRDVFTDVAAWGSTSRSNALAVDFGGGAEQASIAYTTGNFFRMLRVPLAAGSGFPDDVDLTTAPIVVLGHSLWMTNFGGSTDAIGKTIRIMNIPFTIVGVAPPLFTGVDVMNLGRATIWIPLGARGLLEPETRDDLMRRDDVFLESAVRLAPGVGAGDVDRMTRALAARVSMLDPKTHNRFRFRAERLTGMSGGDGGTKELIVAFLLVAAFVVVITCTNVSALLLGRAVARRREIGVRLSLGATRVRLIRQMLTESLVFAVAGALLALLLYTATVKIAYAMVPELIWGLEPEPATFFFAAAFALAHTIAVGLAPALHATSADVAEVMKNSGNHAIRRSRLQATFVVIQLASSAPVLVVTSLVLADLRGSVNANADKAPASVVTMRTELVGPAYGDGPTGVSQDSATVAARATFGLIRRRLEEVPGVESAAMSRNGARNVSFEVPEAGNATPQVNQVHVTPGYFSTLGIPIVRGRAIGADDDRPGSVAVVVNQEAANLLWPGTDPVGRRLVRRSRGADGESTTLVVIGVAEKAPYDEAETPQVFTALSSVDATNGRRAARSAELVIIMPVGITVRTTGEARLLVPSMRAAIREIEPFALINGVTTLAERYAGRRREAIQMNLAAFAIGIAALVLASLGLYAIIAFAVAQRTREIGIRLAVGATAGDVVRQFFRDGLKVTAIGLAIGLPVAIVGIRVVQASVLGFTIQNVAAVLLVVPVLIVVAGLASWLPARRAGRVDPLIALRSE
jgi:predicted permease